MARNSNSSIKKKIKSQFTADNIIFSVLVAILIGYFLFQSFYLKTDSPQVAVTTTSMVPTYMGFCLTSTHNQECIEFDSFRGDLLIVENKPVQVGDTIVFQKVNQSIAIVHRVVAEKIEGDEKFYATKGDNNEKTDISRFGNDFGWINEKDIKGVVIFAIHNLGWFSLELQNSFVRIFLILAMLFILGLGLLEYYSNKNKSSNEEETKLKKKSKNKKVYLKVKSRKMHINRPNSFITLFLFSIVMVFALQGFFQFNSGSNEVSFLSRSETEFSNIDLSSFDVEDFSDSQENFYILNFKLKITSHGIFNSINRIEVTSIYAGFDNDFNPTYVWNIVYDFYGEKIVNGALIFKDISPISSINSEISIKIYSYGLFAENIKSSSQSFVVTFP